MRSALGVGIAAGGAGLSLGNIGFVQTNVNDVACNDHGVQGCIIVTDAPKVAKRNIRHSGDGFVLTFVAGGTQIQIVFQIAAHVIVLISVFVINAAVLKGQFGAEAIPTKIFVFEVHFGRGGILIRLHIPEEFFINLGADDTTANEIAADQIFIFFR